MNDQPDILPPSDIAAESCVLGSMLIGPSCVPAVRSIIGPGSFVLPQHRTIFETVCAMHDRGVAVDPVTLRNELVVQGQWDIGGVDRECLMGLLYAVPDAAHAEHYAAIVRDKFLLRGIIAVTTETMRRAYQADEPGEVIADATTKLASLNNSATATEVCRLEDAAVGVMEDLESGQKTRMLATSVPFIDGSLGGLGVREMLVIAARPSMGKSTLIRQIAFTAAEFTVPTLLVSCEEDRTKIARNLISLTASIENNVLRRGQLQRVEFDRAVVEVGKMGKVPLWIADKAFNMRAIRAVCGMMVARHGVRIILIDHMHRIRAKGNSRYEIVTEISNDLSCMFKELGVAGVVAAQLNREAPHRSNKRPTLSDLRESGAIEQDADVILGLHREDYYRVTGESTEGAELDHRAELCPLKFRDGMRGQIIELETELKYQRFVDRTEAA